MQKPPKISVIMPAYNSEKYVAEAVESVLAQTYPAWELLAVDDGSTDHTGDIIDEYAARDARIKAVHTEHKGVSHARNTGLDLAGGEWTAFLDSDDMYEKDAFEVMLAEAAEADLIIGNYRLYPETDKQIILKESKQYRNFSDMKPDIAECLKTGVLNGVWGKMIRRDRIRLRFREGCQHCEDTIFLVSLLETIGQIRLITHSVYLYRRINESSLTHQFDYTSFIMFEIIADHYINCFQDAGITNRIYANYLNGIIGQIRILMTNPRYHDDYVKEILSALLRRDFLRRIPVTQYPLSPFGQRMAALLLIGDADLIMDEFRKSIKEKHK